MRRSWLSLLLSMVMVIGMLPVTAAAAEGTATVQRKESSWKLDSATYQDPGNVVIQWTAKAGYTYKIYRSGEKNGAYTQIGTTSTDSYRDSDASYPKTYYYQVEAMAPGSSLGFGRSPWRPERTHSM